MGQESVYVRTRDEPVWRRVEEVAKEKGIPRSQVVIIALKYFFNEVENDDLLKLWEEDY